MSGMSDLLRELEQKVRELEQTARKTGQNLESALAPLREELARLSGGEGRSDKSDKAEAEAETQGAEAGGQRWARVGLARHPERPTALDYVERLTENFTELHGDRLFGDDPALLGGPALWQGRPVMLLFQQKGRNTKTKIKRRFGMSNPEGYRKAMRLMDMADKFSLPVVALIDTPGAYPGIEAEERGQGWAIAESIQRMSQLKVPAVCVVIGEGGSGGALAIGVGNRVLIMENAWYSVISPEACASIIWKDAAQAPAAAEALRLTAPDLLELGIVEEVIAEPAGGAQEDVAAAAEALGVAVSRHLDELSGLSVEELQQARVSRFRAMGVFEERQR